MSPAGIRAEDRGAVRVLTISNPARRNALDELLLQALSDHLDRAEQEGVRVLVLRGEAGAFCAGYDLGALALPEGDRLPDDHLGQVLARLQHHPAASIALVEGPAFGAGCELAATCDFRVGSGRALFCMPPARLGIVYAPEGIAKLIGLVGLQNARRMFLTGMRVPAETAKAWGLLDALESESQAELAAFTLAEEMAANAPLAVKGMRRVFNALEEPGLGPTVVAELRALRRQAFLSDDAREGRTAFLEKRRPVFKGR